jgi:hypothetical protein
MKIDLSSPDGNTLVLLGYAKRYLENRPYMDKETAKIIQNLLDNFVNMEYSDIIKELEKTNLFTFIK